MVGVVLAGDPFGCLDDPDGVARSSTRPHSRLGWWRINWATARPSMTQDVYMGRRSADSRAAAALEAQIRDLLPEHEFRGKRRGPDTVMVSEPLTA